MIYMGIQVLMDYEVILKKRPCVGSVGRNKSKEKHLHKTSVALKARIDSRLLVSAQKTMNSV